MILLPLWSILWFRNSRIMPLRQILQLFILLTVYSLLLLLFFIVLYLFFNLGGKKRSLIFVTLFPYFSFDLLNHGQDGATNFDADLQILQGRIMALAETDVTAKFLRLFQMASVLVSDSVCFCSLLSLVIN